MGKTACQVKKTNFGIKSFFVWQNGQRSLEERSSKTTYLMKNKWVSRVINHRQNKNFSPSPESSTRLRHLVTYFGVFAAFHTTATSKGVNGSGKCDATRGFEIFICGSKLDSLTTCFFTVVPMQNIKS